MIHDLLLHQFDKIWLLWLLSRMCYLLEKQLLVCMTSFISYSRNELFLTRNWQKWYSIATKLCVQSYWVSLPLEILKFWGTSAQFGPLQGSCFITIDRHFPSSLTYYAWIFLWGLALIESMLVWCHLPKFNSLWFHMALKIQVNTGSGNGLLPNGTKPLPKPVLTNH